MEPPPRPTRWDIAAWGGALAALGLAHLLGPGPQLRYAAWLAVFTVWMAWFVSYGVRWLSG